MSNNANSNKTVAFYTLGCKLNFAETSALSRQFNEPGFDITPFTEKADIYIINTCSVTSDANRDCRKTVRRALRQNPDAYVVVTGCYAQLEPDEIAAIEGVDLVLGAKEKFDVRRLAGMLQKTGKPRIFRSDVNEAVDFHHALSSSDRTRAFLKVQDGCDYKCTFCTIPMARGKSRSPLVSELLDQALAVQQAGFNELVLTGVNAGDFGRYNGETFLQLLEQLDSKTTIPRIRVSSIEPNLLTPDIIAFAAESRAVQPHFHMPLQSGSDSMLRIMKRRYDTRLYRQRVEAILSRMPDACIGVDVITGHPGETEQRFNETRHFLEELPIAYLHVFTYSERPGTQAVTMDNSLPVPERKKRTFLLRKLSEKKRYSFDSRFTSEVRQVLLEDDDRSGWLSGWTDNYIRVAVPAGKELINRTAYCHLNERTLAHEFAGSLVELCPQEDTLATTHIQAPVGQQSVAIGI